MSQEPTEKELVFSQAISIPSDWDYSSFFKNDFLADCTICLSDVEKMKAHVFVLANGSGFFHDMFLGDMTEAKTHVVKITHNPLNLLPKVIEFLYTGKLEYSFNEVMALLSIARYYKIDQLEKELKTTIENRIKAEDVFPLCDQCFELELTNELEFMAQFISKFFDTFNIEEISDRIDVNTFVLAVKPLKKKPQDLIQLVTKFLGSYNLSEVPSEQEAILSLFDPTQSGLKDLFTKANVSWVPDTFLKKLR